MENEGLKSEDSLILYTLPKKKNPTWNVFPLSEYPYSHKDRIIRLTQIPVFHGQGQVWYLKLELS